MDYMEAVVLGIVQGVTEFLPISSTAHLSIVPKLLGWGDPGAAFSAVIQLGTVAALILYFWRDLAAMAAGSLSKSADAPRQRNMILGIGLATVPIVVCGLALQHKIEHEFRSLWVMAGAAFVFAVLLMIGEMFSRSARRDYSSITIRDSILIGIAQTFSLVPGASRSGSTMTGAFFVGLERSTAARFSFLISIPAVAGAGFHQLYKSRAELSGLGWGPLVVSTAVSGIVGFLSLDLLLKYLKTRSVLPFVVYRLGLAAALAALLATGRIQP